MPRFLTWLVICLLPWIGGHSARGDVFERTIFFYQSPDLSEISGLIRQLEEAKKTSSRKGAPVMIGFLAGLAAKYPDQLERWMDHPYEEQTRKIVAVALAHAGFKDIAMDYSRRNDFGEDFLRKLSGAPRSLLARPVRGPSDQDMLWGAFSATGDVAYARRILEDLMERVQRGRVDIGQMFAVSKARRWRRMERVKPIFETLDDDGLRDLVMGSAALWSMSSYAHQHGAVKAMMERAIATDPSSDIGRFLRRDLFQAHSKMYSKNENVSNSVDELKIVLSTAHDSDFLEHVNSYDEFMGSFDFLENDFEKDDVPHVIMFAVMPPETDGQISIALHSPSGESVNLGTMVLSRSEKHGLTGKAFLPPEHIARDSGIYTVSARIDVARREPAEVVHRYFLDR